MRLMANIKRHQKTGIYWYRRVVPAALRGRAPVVEGFPSNPDRTEFTLSLRTRSKADANREAARIDAAVGAALATASAARNAAAAMPKAPPTSIVTPMVAFAALERWEAGRIRAAELRVFNEPDRETVKADPARSDLVVTLRERPMRHTKAWMRIEGFDARLAEALTSEGLAVGLDHPCLPHLRDAFAKSWDHVLTAEWQMSVGCWEWLEPQEDAPQAPREVVLGSRRALTRTRTLREMFDDYLKEARKAGMTLRSEGDARNVFRRFLESAGAETDAATVDSSMVREFRDKVAMMPSRPSRANAALPLGTLLRRLEGRADVPRLSRKTVGKWLDFLHAAFAHGQLIEAVEVNPVQAARFRKGRRATPAARVEFEPEDLRTIFASSLFKGYRKPGQEHLGGTTIQWGARYWVMLLGVQTGARINEIGQLRVGDVRCDPESGIWFISIAADAETLEGGRRLKTAASARVVPLHPRLVELGFLDYVEQRRNGGTEYLFPDLEHHSASEPTKNLSRWYGRYFDRIGITDRRKSFHSFRHLMKTWLRRRNINRDVSDFITGHARSGVSGSYGSAPRIEELSEVISDLRLPFLDDLDRPAAPLLTAPLGRGGGGTNGPHRASSPTGVRSNEGRHVSRPSSVPSPPLNLADHDSAVVSLDTPHLQPARRALPAREDHEQRRQ